ncbi:hypothetical protein Fcan01_22777 [Folsomia candida]|uniref:Uncharacterized protein n=1 Tax=Folsomia candida TaxID=158441 RepID=A0A226DBK8_FOLCA|nr:hypothetical protein Fcan01_22777 [Folsomia candida]
MTPIIFALAYFLRMWLPRRIKHLKMCHLHKYLKMVRFSLQILTKAVATLFILVGFETAESIKISRSLSSFTQLGIRREINIVANGELIKREITDRWWGKCLLFGPEIFSTSRKIPKFNMSDAYFRTSQGIILDYYKLERNNFVRSRIVKNRYQMVIKVLLERLNLSVDACGRHRFPRNGSERHIHFGVSSYIEQSAMSGISQLIHSREQFKVKFATVKQKVYIGNFMTLISPVGWKLLVASVLVGVTLGTLLQIHISLSSKLRTAGGQKNHPISPILIVMFFVQTFLDQCNDPAVTLGRGNGLHRGIRYLYLSWLLYCFIVTATYRSNLINMFSQPGHTTHIKGLAIENENIAGMGTSSRPGQRSDVKTILDTEAATSCSKRETFQDLGKKYNQKHIQPAAIDILQGRYNYLDDSLLAEAAFEIMDKRFGVNKYAVGEETLVVEEFWANSKSLKTTTLLCRPDRSAADLSLSGNPMVMRSSQISSQRDEK